MVMVFLYYCLVLWLNMLLISLQCENSLKSEAAKFQALCERFTKEKAAYVQALQGTS